MSQLRKAIENPPQPRASALLHGPRLGCIFWTTGTISPLIPFAAARNQEGGCDESVSAACA